MGQGQVSQGVSVLFWHAMPVGNILWKPLAIGKKIEFGYKVSFDNKVTSLSNICSMGGLTAYCNPPEVHVLGRLGLTLFD